MHEKRKKLIGGELVEVKTIMELIQLIFTGYRVNFCEDGIFVQTIEKKEPKIN